MPVAAVIVVAAAETGVAAAIGSAVATTIGVATVSTAVATAVGVGVISGTITAAQGGDVSDILQSAVVSGVSGYVGGAASTSVGGSLPAGTSQAVTNAVKSGAGVSAATMTASVLSGENVGTAVEKGLTAGVTGGIGGYIASSAVGATGIKDPTAQAAIGGGVGGAVVGSLTGGDVKESAISGAISSVAEQQFANAFDKAASNKKPIENVAQAEQDGVIEKPVFKDLGKQIGPATAELSGGLLLDTDPSQRRTDVDLPTTGFDVGRPAGGGEDKTLPAVEVTAEDLAPSKVYGAGTTTTVTKKPVTQPVIVITSNPQANSAMVMTSTGNVVTVTTTTPLQPNTVVQLDAGTNTIVTPEPTANVAIDTITTGNVTAGNVATGNVTIDAGGISNVAAGGNVTTGGGLGSSAGGNVTSTITDTTQTAGAGGNTTQQILDLIKPTQNVSTDLITTTTSDTKDVITKDTKDDKKTGGTTDTKQPFFYQQPTKQAEATRFTGPATFAPGSEALAQALRIDAGAPIFGGDKERRKKSGWNVESLRYMGNSET